MISTSSGSSFLFCKIRGDSPSVGKTGSDSLAFSSLMGKIAGIYVGRRVRKQGI